MDQRLEYIKKLETKISETQVILDSLEAEKEKKIQEAQHEEIENLEQYLEHAQLHLHDISAAATDAWLELKESADELVIKISESIKKLLN